jgi:C_GCAxxG_C_C family probable redox protein
MGLAREDAMKSEEAGKVFEGGFNCAQSVLAPFARDYGLSDDTAYRLASVFGAGMGRMQGTCGAVTGAFMALGLRHGFSSPKDPEGRARILGKSKEFVAEFKKEFGTISCRELLGCDLNTDEGRNKHEEDNQRELICRKCVEAAAGFAEALMR